MIVLFLCLLCYYATMLQCNVEGSSDIAMKEAHKANAEIDMNMRSLELAMALPWEGLLQSAPLSIFLLSQLIVIAARKDFKLTVNAKSGYKLIKGDRFRVVMVQVGHFGFYAFNEANKNMDQIRLHMASIPSNVETTLMILGSNYTHERIAMYIKDPIAAIQNAADEAMRLGERTYAKFYEVQLLTAEVVEVLATSQGINDESLRRTREDIKVAEDERKARKEREKMLTKQLQKLGKDVDQARAAYEQALRDIPNEVAAWFSNIFNPPAPTRVIQVAMTPQATGLPDLSVEDVLLVDVARSVQHGLGGLNATLNKGQNATGILTLLDVLTKGFGDQLRQSESKKDSSYFKPVKELLTKSLDLVSAVRSVLGNKEKLKLALVTMKRLTRKAKVVSSRVPDSLSDAITYENVTVGGTNERYKARMAEKTLDNLKKIYSKTFDTLVAENEKLKKVILRLGRLDLDQINTKQILEILSEAIRAIAQIRTNWAKLLDFFQMVSSLAKITLADHTSKLLSYIKVGVAAKDDQLMSSLGRILQDSADGTTAVANFLYAVSSAYMDISQRYIMGPVSGLSKLLSVTNFKDQKRRLDQLQKESVAAQTEIIKICVKHKATFEKDLEKDKAKIKEIFDKIPATAGSNDYDMQ